MTIFEEQELFDLLGYNPEGREPPKIRRTFCDGIDGPKTQAAREAFRRDYGCGAEGLIGALAGMVPKVEPGSTSSFDQLVEETLAEDPAPELRQYLRDDGYYHIPKGIDIPVSEHFRSHELDCRCNRASCKETIVHPKLLEGMEYIRNRTGGRAITITDSGGSGYRCPAHNAETPGAAANSLHRYGLAADLHCNGLSPSQLAAIAEQLNPGEIGRYSWGIHFGAFRFDGLHTRFTG